MYEINTDPLLPRSDPVVFRDTADEHVGFVLNGNAVVLYWRVPAGFVRYVHHKFRSG